MLSAGRRVLEFNVTPKSDRRLNAVMSQAPDASSMSSRRVLFFCLGVVIVAAVGVSSRAFAFTNAVDYGTYPSKEPATRGFGAGRYFTGSPADGYSCEVCHSATPNYSFPLAHKGLPLDGYVPGEQYKIEITWPEATNAYAMAQTQGLNPVTTLLAEFVAEDGGPAGTVAFPNKSERAPASFSNLYCETLAMATTPQQQDEAYAMDIYVQDTASLATVLSVVPQTKAAAAFEDKCTVDRGKDVDGNEYERRCILAMKPCGAQRVKFTWTAPDEWRGPIWFSAGFVTSYDRTTEPNDNDFVTTLSIPLNPGYQGGQHVNVLESGCSVAHGPRAQSSSGRGFALVLLSLLAVVIARRRQRRASWVALATIALLCIGCERGDGLITNVAGNVGAYETVKCNYACDLPIECRASAWVDAGTAEEAAEARKLAAMDMGTGMPAAGPSAAAGTGAAGTDAAPGVKGLGTITAQFVTAQPAELVSDWVRTEACLPIPNCVPHYVTVWIEADRDGERKYVRTLLGSQGMFRVLSLVRYYRLGSDCQVPAETVFIDAMASASLYAHQPHTVTWDGLYGSGYKAAEPGLYHLRIEVAIDEVHHFEVADIPFMFGGPAPTTETSLPADAHTGVTLTYTPTPP
jgi:hypothetical protein